MEMVWVKLINVKIMESWAIMIKINRRNIIWDLGKLITCLVIENQTMLILNVLRYDVKLQYKLTLQFRKYCIFIIFFLFILCDVFANEKGQHFASQKDVNYQCIENFNNDYPDDYLSQTMHWKQIRKQIGKLIGKK